MTEMVDSETNLSHPLFFTIFLLFFVIFPLSIFATFPTTVCAPIAMVSFLLGIDLSLLQFIEL
jgi:hypothetical protein